MTTGCLPTGRIRNSILIVTLIMFSEKCRNTRFLSVTDSKIFIRLAEPLFIAAIWTVYTF